MRRSTWFSAFVGTMQCVALSSDAISTGTLMRASRWPSVPTIAMESLASSQSTPVSARRVSSLETQ